MTRQTVGAWTILAPPLLGPVEARGRPTLSVVIPYYRGAETIRAAVQSVLEQTVAPDEIVICDDGSPDDLEAALGSLASEVRIVRKENGGAASAMNAAVRAAEGEFVVQLDQDDLFLPRRIEAIAAVATARPDVDIIATDAFLEYLGKPAGKLSETAPFHAENQRQTALQRNMFAWPAIRRSRLLGVGGFDESFAAAYDWEGFMRLILAGALAAFVVEPLYVWRISTGSLSSDGIRGLEATLRGHDKVLASGTLDTNERALVESQMAANRRILLRVTARLAVEEGHPGARRRSLQVALGRGFSFQTRAKAAMAAVSPGLARRLLASRPRDPMAERWLR